MEAVTLACVLVLFCLMTAYFVRVMTTFDVMRNDIENIRIELSKARKDIDQVDDRLIAFWDWCDEDIDEED